MIEAEFAEQLRQLLPNLYDPAYLVPPQVADILSAALDTENPPGKETVIAQIEALRPGPQIPQTARIRRLYQVLHLRYVEQWTLAHVADELGITVRHLSREQTRAIAFLADRLWRSAQPEASASQQMSALSESLASLAHASGPASADLGSALRRTSELVRVVAEAHRVTVTVLPAEPGIMVPVLPSVLAQILVRVMTQMVTHTDGGEVQVEARTSDSQGICCLVASPYVGPEPTSVELAGELLQSQRGELKSSFAQGRLEIEISFPLVRKKTVLVIDDNADLIHYYQQCVANAPYQVVGVTQGAEAVSRAVELNPNVIVLDLMLPDKDGWDVLEDLQAQPTLTGVPIIIASVVAEQELAMALGATLCLKKPVRRAELVAALDAVAADDR